MAEKSPPPADMDAYIAQFPDDVQQILARIRAVVHESMPGVGEKISYGMPCFTLNGDLIWIGAYKRHIGLYPRTPAMETALKEALATYKSTKGSVHFPLNQPIPYDLIGEIVRVRAAEIAKPS